MDWTLEVVVVPVSDVDRSRAFYEERLGFHVDHDTRLGDAGRLVQLTPPGSGCSIVIGEGVLPPMTPGSIAGLQLVVADLRAAHAQLVDAGVDVSEIQVLAASPRPAADPLDDVGFVFFEDPDGNGWAVQQISSRGGPAAGHGWRELERQDPELATFGAARLRSSPVAYLATVAAEGAPRVHPVTPIVGGGHLFVFMEPTSPKGKDLDRGSAYALHAGVEDQDGGAGEFRVSGRARRVTETGLRQVAVDHAPYAPRDRYVLFELLVADAFSTVYDEDGEPVRRRWRA